MLTMPKPQQNQVRHRRVVAYEPSVGQSLEAIVLIPYFDTAFEGEGRGTYWVPLALSGSRRKRQRELQQVAEAAAKGIAREYAIRRGIDPDA